MTIKNYINKSLLCVLVLAIAACAKYERTNPNDLLGEDGTPNVAIESYEVVSDNNSDAKLQKGETATIKVLVKNTGTKFTQIASASFTSNSPKLTVQNFTLLENALSYVGKPSNIGELQIKIASNVSAGETLTCNAQITDKAGNIFNTTLSIIINESKPSPLAFIGADMQGYNEANGVTGDYSKGLTPSFDLAIRNNGATDYEGNLQISITSLNAAYPFQYTVTEPAYITPGEFTGTTIHADCLPQNVPDNTVLPLNVAITDKWGGIIERQISVTMKPNTAKIDFVTYEIWSGSPEPGATLWVEATVKNSGGRALYFTQSGAKISSTSSYLSNLQIDLSSPTINPGQSMQNFFTIITDIKANCPRGIKIPITIELTTDEKCPTKFTSIVELNVQ